MFLLLAIFVAGLIHGIGPDHLAAITAFGVAVENNFRRVIWFAVRFAAAHAVVIAIAGVLLHFGRDLLSEGWQRAFDIGAGGLLVLTGLAVLIGLLTGKIKVHQHLHTHHHHPHKHLHVHVIPEHSHDWHHEHAHQGTEHVHGGLAATLGILFALGGTRSLLMAVPLVIASTLWMTMLRVTVLVIGIIVSMVVYAFITQHTFEALANKATALGRAPTFLKASSYVLAGFCIVAGMLTINDRLHLMTNVFLR
jgi:ABC-type nickel/cobalt efflux system permease component RcnA